MSTGDAIVDKKDTGFAGGLAAGVPIALGYWPIAMAYGLLAKSIGLDFFDCVAMSIIVFAGASQFMALNLLAVGCGFGEIVLATFLINLRHFLMSASIGEKITVVQRPLRALLAFGITDETFAVGSLKDHQLSGGFVFGMEILAYSSWTVGSGAGYAVGAALPEALQTGMGIALYAMFIGLLVPPAKKSRRVLLLGASAAAFSGLFSLVLSGGWPMVAATIVAALGAAVLDGKEDKPFEQPLE